MPDPPVRLSDAIILTFPVTLLAAVPGKSPDSTQSHCAPFCMELTTDMQDGKLMCLLAFTNDARIEQYLLSGMIAPGLVERQNFNRYDSFLPALIQLASGDVTHVLFDPAPSNMIAVALPLVIERLQGAIDDLAQ